MTARQLVHGHGAVALDAYDAIELCDAGDEPAQILAAAARAVADLWNDPPMSSWQRTQVAEVFPELATALDELLGGGPLYPGLTWADVRLRVPGQRLCSCARCAAVLGLELPPDAVVAANSPTLAPADRFPSRIVVFCDRCGVEHAGEYLVSEDCDSPTRLGYARKHMRSLGWQCDATGDFCPVHAAVTA
jgi:hypothetical protein